ncbi:glycosyltransferase family 2 protein [Aquimarina sp. MMG015]|uniref:glycosyltransferase family 2 protein n=1 Tax=unclassified Aquimarina TaxID=2627091 RepID=UPI000E48D7A6|nr:MULTISPECIES: glycosyltransferase family A protein [unclassified Aquimarina]AXT55048.1 glycosyltransferase family 2 protein [Aquimarina sp. AD1]MBQ4802003.1 glycosyltransferase family 2 protein [Aquimarina sp. MMG015]RKN22946.1 glycosyltransferase [Aquimarina sp. AD1]
MKTITVFTPTYNRAYCLHKCYESLIKQSNQDFVWLIIDDGSTDDTETLVASWIKERKIDIQYHYQENQGMHGGHNAAYRLTETTLNVCVDSDDCIGEEAIEKILVAWEKIKDKPEFAGLVGLDADHTGKLIGTKIPEHIKETTLYDLYNVHKVLGDKKLVYRTEVVKKYPPYPIFEGERFVPLGYLYQLIDQDYKLLPINEVLCEVEYMQDGSSMNILKQYRRHPKGFAFSRKSRMKLAENFKDQFKNAIHYVSSAIFTKNGSFISESPKKLTTVLAIPFGILLNLYIRYKTKGEF